MTLYITSEVKVATIDIMIRLYRKKECIQKQVVNVTILPSRKIFLLELFSESTKVC